MFAMSVSIYLLMNWLFLVFPIINNYKQDNSIWKFIRIESIAYSYKWSHHSNIIPNCFGTSVFRFYEYMLFTNLSMCECSCVIGIRHSLSCHFLFAHRIFDGVPDDFFLVFLVFVFVIVIVVNASKWSVAQC